MKPRRITQYAATLLFVILTPMSFSANTLYPILLIHGIHGTPDGWSELTKDFVARWKLRVAERGFRIHLNYANTTFEPTSLDETQDIHVFEAPGTGDADADVFCIDFHVRRDGTAGDDFGGTDLGQSDSNEAGISKQGKAVGIAIKHVLALRFGSDAWLDNPAAKVVLVGHSMGGLAAREYLQRCATAPLAAPLWWVDQTDRMGGHRVAHIVTIGTPHRGSDIDRDIGFWIDLRPELAGIKDWLVGINYRSEGMRDVRAEYKPIIPPAIAGVFLNGGLEGSIPSNDILNVPERAYHNQDVDCDGTIDIEAIAGLNEMPRPGKDILFSCFVGRTFPSDLNSYASGDSVVTPESQDLNSIYPNIARYREIEGVAHISLFLIPGETSKTSEIMQLLDEPDTTDSAFDVSVRQDVRGFIQNWRGSGRDIDYYRLRVRPKTHVRVSLTQHCGPCALFLYAADGITELGRAPQVGESDEPLLIEHESGSDAAVLYVRVHGDPVANSDHVAYVLRVDDPLPEAAFVDVTQAAGLPSDPSRRVSAAFGDFDADGWVDIYQPSINSQAERLFRNLGSGRFALIANPTGIGATGDFLFANSGDYDNDGHIDLLLAGLTKPRLFKGDGFGHFTDTTALSGLVYRGVCQNGSFVDYDNDGWLDVFLNILGASPVLGRSTRDGTYTDVSVLSGVAALGGNENGNSHTFFDCDGDGDLDLVLAQGARLIVARNEPTGTYVKDEAASADFEVLSGGDAYGAVCAGDYDNDGCVDLFAGAFSSAAGVSEDSHFLYRNRGEGRFEATTAPAGLKNVRQWNIGAVFADVDNDCLLDLITVGNSPTNRLYINRGNGTFADATDGFAARAYENAHTPSSATLTTTVISTCSWTGIMAVPAPSLRTSPRAGTGWNCGCWAPGATGMRSARASDCTPTAQPRFATSSRPPVTSQGRATADSTSASTQRRRLTGSRSGGRAARNRPFPGRLSALWTGSSKSTNRRRSCLRRPV